MFFLEYKLLLLAAAAAVGAFAALHRRSLRARESALARDVEALGRLAEGGSPATALQVTTAALVESRATSLACASCGEGPMKVAHHTVEDHGGARLRVVRVACDACGSERAVYVRIAASS